MVTVSDTAFMSPGNRSRDGRATTAGSEQELLLARGAEEVVLLLDRSIGKVIVPLSDAGKGRACVPSYWRHPASNTMPCRPSHVGPPY